MLSAKRLLSWILGLVIVLGVCTSTGQPALAAKVDSYVWRYLQAKEEPVPVPLNAAGDTQLFSGEDFSAGKALFDDNCKICHLGGSTVQNPGESLAFDVLQGATPPRDNIANLIEFQRLPMTYNGTETSFWCREVSPDWLSDEELTLLDAFILRAAAVAPEWGVDLSSSPY